MSKLFNWAAARLVAAFALALCFATPLVSWADAITAVNPVTGETETYTYKFVGTDSVWNNTANWQDSNGSNPSAVPAKSDSNTWAPILFDQAENQSIAIGAALSVEGWNLRMGLYNGASVQLNNLVKLQSDTATWITADSSSHCTIAHMVNKKLVGANPLCLYSANQGGIAWTEELSSSGNGNGTPLPFHYYLAGNGTVAYNGGIAAAAGGAHVIRQADVTLSGTSQVSSKTLVSFTSSSTTFTADAAIKVYDIDGTTLKETVAVTSVRSSEAAIQNTTSALTTDDAVGTCELVQCTDGIVLYYVDGDPSAVVAKTYKPSININFTSGTALSTVADVGYVDYAVPGTSWNNLIGNNGTLSTVTQIDSTGAASTVAGVGVTISGTRGYWTCGSVSAANDLRQGYIDDAAGANASPQVVVSGIPYYSYYAVVYFSNNDANVKFGYVTINGTNYKWDSENSALVECEGADTDSWGASSPTAWTEGGNYIVTPTFVNADGTFTVVGHRVTSARAGIAAIQIVEVPKTAEEGELVINVSGDTTYTVSEDATYTTVYVTGAGTLAFSGEGAITTTTLNVGAGATVPMGSSITPTTVTGAGTVVYDGAQPSTTLGFDDSDNWFGTVWVKNIGTSPAGETATTAVTLGTDTNTAADNTINLWGNVNSCVKFTNVRGHVAASDCPWTLILEDDGDKYAWYNNNGWTAQNKDPVFAKLTGEGTFYDQANIGCRQNVTFTDATEFSGTFTVAGKRIGLGGVNTAQNNEAYRGTVEVVSGAAATIASGKTWTTGTGFRINGALNVNGTLAAESTATTCVTGSGTVVFTGRAPTPTGDTWWKNANWTGTVQMKDVTNLVGASNYSGTNFLPVDYGNTGSVLELYNCSGWLPNNSNYQCTVPLKITGTLTINNGISGSKFVISSLSGDGTIYTDSNTATITIQVLEAANFTGKVQLNSKRVVFGNTLPSEFTVGNIYVGEGFSFTVPNSNVAWYGTGGITLAGELKAAALSNFGGGTTITTTDTGVFTLVSNSNTDDMDVDYTRIQGTGTLKFDGTNYRTISTNNFPTAMIVENNISNGLIHRLPGEEVAIGSLSGTGQMRSDWGGSGSTGDRDLRILQAKDTTYSGLFASNNDRIDEVYVAPGASTAGTLTLSGTQTASNGLIVETGASVNLTGTWVGATTVAGTFGGTGTLTGNLTFSDGATFKAFATDDDGLSVSGTVTCPEEGTVTVDASALEDPGTYALLTASGLDADKFALAEGAPEGATLAVVEEVLTLTVPTPSVSITIPEVANATVAVTVGGVAVTPENGVVTVEVGSAVVVTYTAAEGYTIANGTIAFTAAADTTTVDTSSVTVTEYVAWIYDENGDLVGDPYTVVLNAVQTFLTSTAGNSIKFKTSIEESYADFHTMLLVACDYDDETFTYTRKPSVAKVTSGIQEYLYTSLVDAVNDTISGDTVTLLADVTLTDKLVVSNKTVTITADSAKTITGQLRVVDGSNVTIGENVTITSDKHPTVFVLGDPAVKTAGTAKSVLVVNGTVLNTNAGFDKTFAIAGNGLDTKGVDITINGTVRNANGIAIYKAFPGDLVVNGTVEGASAISIKDGTLTVNSGASVRATLASGVEYVGNNNGDSPTGDAIIAPYYDLSRGYGTPVVSIAGGEITVTDTENCTGIEAYDFEGATAPNDSASNVNVSGGTFNTAVADTYCAEGFEPTDNGKGTYGVRVDKGWIYEDADFPGYTGSWNKEISYDETTHKAAIEDGATYTASKPSAGQLVTINLELSFDAANSDDDVPEGAKAAVRLGEGETEGTYVFQLYTTNELGTAAWLNAVASGVTPAVETDYEFTFVLDMTNKTFTATVDGVALTVDGAETLGFASANASDTVQSIEFTGSGKVTSITGNYEDIEGFVADETIGNVTLTAAQAEWLNGQGNYDALAAKIATMDATAFNNAYLLNLDILDESYQDYQEGDFVVTDFAFETESETEYVVVEVTLERHGALDGGINGTLKLTGAMQLGGQFETKASATISDDDFSEGNTATLKLEKSGALFYKPVIE